ncbi:SGNH/GDSL hydrolase family protein [Aciduricibacillus chroicocephali]|uniref:SGNH/GDSL hydrolase family protein n=1 Tax=Aciduricibacillus chroicocephali TaxID=3054939 RepID=A0ABY9KU10_9BACI|nr:SGNH/GDSL hydrolase family protein [Bacillaceae bacterium 44XB]
MKRRFLIGISLAILFIAGIGLYAVLKPGDDSRNVKPDPTQIQQNSARQQAMAKPRDPEQSGPEAKAVVGRKGFLSRKSTRVVALGDSLTQGVGDSTKSGGYIGILDRKVNGDRKKVRFDNFGHAGDRTDQLYRKIQDPKVSTAIADSDIVLITIGANDIMKIVKSNITNLNYDDFTEERGQYEERLQRVFNELQKINPDAKIYLLGFYNPFLKYFHDIPELNDIVKMWNKTSEMVTEENENIHYIPTKDLFDKSRGNVFYEDNFHPNDKGYQMMADRVLKYVNFK